VFLLPLGDDIEKRSSFPVLGTILVAVNLLAYLYEWRVWTDGQPRHMVQAQTLDQMHELAEAPPTRDIVPKEFTRLINRWGLVPSELMKGKVVGLFTHMFLHADLEHLIGNLLMLWLFVTTLEDALGAARFLGFYLLWGLAGGAAHALMNSGSTTPMIGASGAISGMAGAYIVAFGALTNIRTLFVYWFMGLHHFTMHIPAGLYIFLWIVVPNIVGMILADAGYAAPVAWFAHIGGFAAGAGTMLLFSDEVKERLEFNREGVLQFKAVPGGAGAAAELSADNLPRSCPHCHAQLPDECRITDTMYRCANGDCKRLIYLVD
jgi:membrane associated rhomboid family serine protease